MVATSTTAAFRILELVSVLIPIVFVMLQFTIRYYRNQDTAQAAIIQGPVLGVIGVLSLVIIFAGVSSVEFLLDQSYDETIIQSFQLLRAAMILAAGATIALVATVIADIVPQMVAEIKSMTNDTADRLPTSADPNDRGEGTSLDEQNDELNETEEENHE